MPSNDITFTVTREQLQTQLETHTTVQGEHRIWASPEIKVISDDGPRTAQQVVWYLETGSWHDHLYPTCGEPACTRFKHLTPSRAQLAAIQDEALLDLVQRSSVNLAALYRKGKSKGLLTSRTQYH